VLTGVPAPDVPRLERMMSTFVVGYAISAANGRFAVAVPDARTDWDAEFEADLDDLLRMVEGRRG
jgi:hypothetical protein